MSQAIPTQHPAVVLRSHFALVRALLIASLIAVLGLTTALVVVANDDNDAGVQQSAQSLGTYRYGGFNPATGRPEAAPLPKAEAAPLAARRLDGATDVIPAPAPSPLSRYDGGPEEGTRGIMPQTHTPAPGTRYDGGPEEGSRGPGVSTD